MSGLGVRGGRIMPPFAVSGGYDDNEVGRAIRMTNDSSVYAYLDDESVMRVARAVIQLLKNQGVIK